MDTYTFPSLYIILSMSFYSLSLRTFTPAHFISSTALTTLLFFTLDCFIFSNRSTSSTITSTFSVLLFSNYFFFTNVSSLLSLSTPTFQSGLLLRLSIFSIFVLGMCFNTKSNLDRYSVHLACHLFNFCAFIKYSRFL